MGQVQGIALNEVPPNLRQQAFSIRKGRAWAIAVRRGSYESLFSFSEFRSFSQDKQGNSVLNFGSCKSVEIAMAQVLFPPSLHKGLFGGPNGGIAVISWMR